MPTDTPLQQVLAAALSLLAALLAFAVQKVTGSVTAKLESQRAREMLLRLSEQASDVVHELEQTWAGHLRAAAADGKLEESEVRELKDAALANLRAYLGERGRTEALKILGFKDEAELEALLRSKLEAEVAKLRAKLGTRLSVVAGGAP